MKRAEFPLLAQTGTIYLDNAATTQKPQRVLDVINNFYNTQNANINRGIYNLSEKASIAYENARKTVARFINAAPEEIVFTSGTTQSINILAHMLAPTIQAGDEIVLTIMEHHSNLVPWQQLAKQKNATLKFIPLTDNYQLDMEKAKQLITEKTKIVAVTHMSNVLGTINPIKELTQLAHNVNATIVVDAAQSVPHMSVDVEQLNADFLVFSGHKMCGPTGIGVLYGTKERLQTLSPVQFGGGMIHEVTTEDSTWTTSPTKFEAGTPNIAGAIGLAAAIDFLQTIGMQELENHTKELTQYALQKLSENPSITIVGPTTENRGPVISFTIDGIHPHDVAEILNRSNIAVRAGHHCAMPLMKQLTLPGTTRASFYLYNTKEEIDALCNTLKKVQVVFA